MKTEYIEEEYVLDEESEKSLEEFDKAVENSGYVLGVTAREATEADIR